MSSTPGTGGQGEREESGGGRRGQTETVGFVLVIGLVLLGALLVAVLGGMALDSTEDSLSEDRAEKALTQFDSKAALVALGDSDSHSASFGSGAADRDDIRIEEDNGWMNVTVTNRTTEEVVMAENITLGALVYQGDTARLGYQGGGVWRADRSGGTMISPPEFHYRDATLTLPAITVSGDGVLNDEVTIERAFTREIFPVEDNEELTNPLDNHIVNVTVGSEFYSGWGEYFRERTDGGVEVDDDEETARLTLVTPIGEVTVTGALAGQESAGELLIQGNPHHPCEDSGSHPPYVDSYNSSQDSYCGQYDSEEINDGDELIFGGDIRTDASAGQIQADLVSGGEMTLAGQMTYYGNFSHAEGCEVRTGPAQDCADAQEPGYTVSENDGIVPDDAIDFVVETTVQEFRTNEQHVTLTDGETLTAGEYYTDEIDLDGDSVTLDTTDGDITLAVGEAMHLENGADLSIEGSGQVDIFVNGTSTGQDLLVHGSEVYAPQNNATQMTVLGDDTFVGEITDGGQYTGVIYAPAGEDGTGEVIIDRQGTVFGAVVTGDMTLGKPAGGVGASVHFDKQLEEQQIVPPELTIIPVTFLHITENHITVQG